MAAFLCFYGYVVNVKIPETDLIVKIDGVSILISRGERGERNIF
jgi:hypothetical protein